MRPSSKPLRVDADAGTQPLERLLYRSLAVGLPSGRVMNDLFRVSVVKNDRLEITGALGFFDQNYVQLLEGPTLAIDGLLRTLERDPRHTGLRILLRGASERRLLPQWSMARVDLARLAPETQRLMAADDGLGLTALMATLAHQGMTA